MATLVLVHDGLRDDTDADGFRFRTGVVDGLRAAASAPDRMPRATSWAAEHLAGLLSPGPVTLAAGSDGGSAAVALALSLPVPVERLILCWPATAGDPAVDEPTRAGPRERDADGGTVADDGTVADLLAGGALRGFTDEQVGALPVPLAVLPAVPENTTHVVSRAVELPGTPPPPHPDFPAHLDHFTSAVGTFTVTP